MEDSPSPPMAPPPFASPPPVPPPQHIIRRRCAAWQQGLVCDDVRCLSLGASGLCQKLQIRSRNSCCNMVSANLVLSICICSLACAMMFFPGSIADIVAAIRDISQNSARYRTLYAQMANLEKRLAAAEAVAANCSKIASNGAPLSENALADVAADIETLLRRQNDFVASVGKHLKSHDAGIEQVNNTVVLLWYDINVLREVVNDAAADFNTTKRLIDAFEKNAARFTAASATGDKKIRDNRATPTFGPEEPSAFENVIDDNDENEETDDGAAPLSFGMGGSLNPDGSTPVIVRPKDAPKVVFELHEEGFEKALQEGHQLVVMFYAPWCPHCKTSLGPFEIAGGQSEVGFARINGDEFPELMQRHSIPGFPTIRKYHKGQMIEEYRGDRGVDSFISFGMDRTQSRGR